MQNVGLRLKQERNRKGYSLQYVAASLNVSTTTVYRIEAGNKYLSMELFDRYCELLELNPKDVFSNPAMEERDRIALDTQALFSCLPSYETRYGESRHSRKK